MDIEFDPEKSARNERERGLPFELTAHLEWDKARIYADERRDYGEGRFVALAPMQGRLYATCYTVRGHVRRIISFLKASDREERAYENATHDQ